MKAFKFLSVFAFVVSLLSLGGNAFLYLQYNTESALRAEAESRLVQAEERTSSLEEQAGKATEFEQEVGNLREQIKGYVSQRDMAKKEIDRVSQDAGELRKRVKQLEDQKNLLSEQLNMGEETDKAVVQEAAKLPPPSVSKPVAVTPSAPKKEKTPGENEDNRPSQVLSVNRQFNFVVVNVGIRDRVKIGDTLRVEQNGKLIGRIKVEKLYENFSACTVTEEVKPARIKEGDLVRLT